MTQITHSDSETGDVTAPNNNASTAPSAELGELDVQETPVVVVASPLAPKKRTPSAAKGRWTLPSNEISGSKIATKATKPKAKVAVAKELPVSPEAKRKTASRTPVKTAAKSAKASLVAVKQVKPPSKKTVAKSLGKLDVEEKSKRTKKEKVIRDGFTMPKSDYDLIAVLKSKCMEKGLAIKKGELLRAGLRLLNAASDTSLLGAVKSLETVKTGRPRKV